MSQRKKQTPLTPFLLTYQDYTPSYRDVVQPPESHRSPETRYASFLDPVWQTALRVFQHPPQPHEEAKECPETLDWSTVACVDVLSHKATACPICLDHVYKCPRITKCGHVFCFPCIVQHIDVRRADEAPSTCPMCFDELILQDLKAVRIQRSVSTMNAGVFVLTLRHKNTNVVRLADGNCHNYLQKLHYVTEDSETTNNAPGNMVLTPKMFLTQQFFHICASELHSGGSKSLETCLKVIEKEARTFPSYRFEEQLPILHEKLGTICWESDSWLNDLVSSFSVDVPLDSWERYVHDAYQPLDASADRTVGATEAEAPADSTEEATEAAALDVAPAADAETQLASDTGRGQGFILEAIRKMPYYLAYQLWDGQLHFLTAAALRLLLYDAGMKVDSLVKVTPKLRLTWPHEVCVNTQTKSRYSFLSHLPIGSSVVLHEVELRPHLRERTVAVFADYLRGRRRKIAAQQEWRSRKDELYEEYVQQKSFYGDTR